MCVCVCACVRVCMCMRARVRACVCVCVCVWLVLPPSVVDGRSRNPFYYYYYYIILGPRDKVAPPTSQQVNKFPPKRVKCLAILSSIFFFFPHPLESSPQSANQRQGSSKRANITRTC